MKKVISVVLFLSMIFFSSNMTLNIAKTTKKINLNKTSVTLRVGQKTKLKLDKKTKVKWKSTNKTVATVKNGIVKAKKVGKTKIIAYMSERKAVCYVKVKKNMSKKTPVGVETNTPTPMPLGQTPDVQESPQTGDIEPGVVIVVFKEPYLSSTLAELFPELSIEQEVDAYKLLYDEFKDSDQVEEEKKENLKKQIGTYFVVFLTQTTKESVLEAIEIIEQNNLVKYAEPDYVSYPNQ